MSNSTEVAYNFGQMGSVLITGTSAVTSNGVAAGVGANAVFCAITFLEDTVFDDAGLVSTDNTMFVNSEAVQSNISGNTAVADDETFPKGLTIYGRWTTITLDSGAAVAYVGY